MKGLYVAVRCKESVISDQCVFLLSKDCKIDELRKLLSKNCKFLEQQEEMDCLINEQQKVIASLSKETDYVRSSTLTSSNHHSVLRRTHWLRRMKWSTSNKRKYRIWKRSTFSWWKSMTQEFLSMTYWWKSVRWEFWSTFTPVFWFIQYYGSFTVLLLRLRWRNQSLALLERHGKGIIMAKVGGRHGQVGQY